MRQHKISGEIRTPNNVVYRLIGEGEEEEAVSNLLEGMGTGGALVYEGSELEELFAFFDSKS